MIATPTLIPSFTFKHIPCDDLGLGLGAVPLHEKADDHVLGA
jgi:hypothetical protein